MEYELAQRLDAFVRGEFEEPAFIEELCAVCAATPDFAWDVLAITDQYHRRGKISADRNRTIRFAIERPALERQAPKLLEAEPIASIAATTPAPDRPLQSKIRAIHRERDADRRKLLRYRARIAKLATFARSQRIALAELRRELESARIEAPARSDPAPSAALDVEPAAGVAAAADTTAEAAVVLEAGGVLEQPRPRSRWIALLQAAAAAALLLTVTASPALREPPTAVVVPRAEIIPAPALALPAAVSTPGRQLLSLDRDQTIIAPRERQASLRVQRTGGSSGEVSFIWWTTPSGAKAGVDYRARPPTVEHLPAGVDALTLSIPIIANPLRSHAELFYVQIGHAAGGAAIGAIRRAAVITMPTH
ncbi:MAG: hypothetical protein ABSF94_00885 [Steroidobacteraceae bacterium]|jgi:hypothetical protein